MFSLDDLDFDLENENNQPERDIPSCAPEHDRPSLDVFRKPSSSHSSSNKRNIGPASPSKRAQPVSPLPDPAPKRTTRAVRRKFPGPAGLLPDKPPRSFQDTSLVLDNVEENTVNERDQLILCSQASESTFTDPPFKKLRQDFDIDQPDSPLKVFTVDWVKKKSFSRGLKGRKIPFLGLVLQYVDCSSEDPLVTLRDPTGEIFGALHREVWREMGDQLRPGTAIALKDVGVLSTGVSRRQVILNMTKNNIVTVYSPNEEGDVDINSVQSATCADIVRNVADWQANSAPAVVSPLRSSGIFAVSPAPNFFQTVSAPSRGGTPHGPTAARRASKPFIRNSGSRNIVPSPNIRHNNGNVPENPPENDSPSNFDLFADDAAFEDIEESFESPSNGSPRVEPKNNEKSQANAPFKAKESSNVPTNIYCSQRVLTQAETSILDEVLSGVDLDDFE